MNISDFDHGKTKLDKINNYLQETFGFSIKKEDVTHEAIRNILQKVRDKQSEIVNESNKYAAEQNLLKKNKLSISGDDIKE